MPILAAPYEPPAPKVRADWSGVAAVTWTGWDASEWDMTGRTGGVMLLAGTRGLNMPPVDRFSSSTPALAGSRWRDWRALEREVFWPLRVYSDGGSQAWMDYDRAFWDTLRPDRVGAWDVVQPNGQSRRLWCRFSEDNQHAWDQLPSLSGWGRYGVSLVAEQPFWEGNVVAQTYRTDPPVPFFGGTDGGGLGPTFYISEGSTVETAVIENPGDVAAYPIYTIEAAAAGITSATVGYAGNTVTVGAIAAGQKRIVDTRPDQLTVTDANGADRWSSISSDSQFDVPIPPGSQTLSLGINGEGSITVSFTPLYFRAW